MLTGCCEVPTLLPVLSGRPPVGRAYCGSGRGSIGGGASERTATTFGSEATVLRDCGLSCPPVNVNPVGSGRRATKRLSNRVFASGPWLTTIIPSVLAVGRLRAWLSNCGSTFARAPSDAVLIRDGPSTEISAVGGEEGAALPTRGRRSVATSTGANKRRHRPKASERP